MQKHILASLLLVYSQPIDKIYWNTRKDVREWAEKMQRSLIGFQLVTLHVIDLLLT